MSVSYLVIIGDREALGWVLENERMAFPAHRRALVSALKGGDELFLYTTRGAFKNPGRDRGRVIGLARATTATESLPEPVVVAGRTFALGCRLELLSLAPLRSGVELSPLVEQLTVFPNQPGWRGWLRRPLLELPASDAALLRRLLCRAAGPPDAVLGPYLAAAYLAEHPEVRVGVFLILVARSPALVWKVGATNVRNSGKLRRCAEPNSTRKSLERVKFAGNYT